MERILWFSNHLNNTSYNHETYTNSMSFWLDVDENDTQTLEKYHFSARKDSYTLYTLPIFNMETTYPYKITTHSLKLYINECSVISIHTKHFQALSHLQKELSQSKTLSLHEGIYHILETIITSYFSLIETISNLSDTIEIQLVEDNKDMLKEIYGLKKEITYLRKSLNKTRSIVNVCSIEYPISKNNINYEFLIEQVYSVLDSLEIEKEVLSNMIEIHLSLISNRSNEIMKFLTIFSTIFIPLSFLTGIYGMNFSIMPELDWAYGYIVFWVITGLIVAGMLGYFYKKKWIFNRNK